MPPLTQEQVAAWGDYQEAPWGRLRLDLIRANLARHVAAPPARVLDVGCGFGELAVEFARAGSEVVATDASEAMLAEAAARAGNAPVHWVRCDVDDTAGAFAGERFELVLCHNVLSYVADPAAACAGLVSLLAPGGRFSVTIVNRTAEPLRFAFLLRDLDAALAAASSSPPTRYGATLGADLRPDELDDATGWLSAAGLELETVAGLMLVNHYLGAADETKDTPDGYDAIRRLELALCEREPYRRIAPFLHLIGRRPC